jgi:hypothetical protein
MITLIFLFNFQLIKASNTIQLCVQIDSPTIELTCEKDVYFYFGKDPQLPLITNSKYQLDTNTTSTSLKVTQFNKSDSGVGLYYAADKQTSNTECIYNILLFSRPYLLLLL